MGNQIREIVDSAVENLSRVAEANTILGDAIIAGGSTIIPISQLNFVFVAGGGEYGKDAKIKIKQDENGYFAGGSGGGATLTPIGFLVISRDGVEIVNSPQESTLSKIVDVVAGLVNDKK